MVGFTTSSSFQGIFSPFWKISDPEKFDNLEIYTPKSQRYHIRAYRAILVIFRVSQNGPQSDPKPLIDLKIAIMAFLRPILAFFAIFIIFGLLHTSAAPKQQMSAKTRFSNIFGPCFRKIVFSDPFGISGLYRCSKIPKI